eukprot:c10139_g1_i1 orf=1-279(-)
MAICARIKWAWKGATSNRFLFKALWNRNNRAIINCLTKEMGVVIETYEDISNAFTQYYKEMIGSSHPPEVECMKKALEFTTNRISKDDRGKLE